MNIKSKLALALTGILCCSVGMAIAADKQQSQDRLKDQTQDQTQLKDQDQLRDQDQKLIYGWELMSVKERSEHRKKMLSMKSEQERTAYLEEHHKLMQQRAQERGVKIPDMPAQSGFGAGQGPGAGGGGRKN